MKMGIVGGLLFGGLLASALLGLIPGLLLYGLGAVAGYIAMSHENSC